MTSYQFTQRGSRRFVDQEAFAATSHVRNVIQKYNAGTSDSVGSGGSPASYSAGAAGGGNWIKGSGRGKTGIWIPKAKTAAGAALAATVASMIGDAEGREVTVKEPERVTKNEGFPHGSSS